jgi:tungstate transport system ATP-binding protein
MVHQAPVLFRGTVLQNVTYGLRIRGMARAERARRAGRALDLVGAGSLARRRTSGLSGGEQHRVALARALVLEPSVLLLDEPTAHADPDSRAAIERVIRSLPGAGTKVIASTHLMDTAYRLCDELVRLESGRVAPARENIIKGAVERTEESLSLFRPAFSGSPLILCPARQGSFSVAVIPMDELIFSREPLSSSARNNLRGRVTGVEQQEGLLRVDVDCGVALSGLITRAASAELAVEKGRDIVVTFKASAVRLF